MADIAKLGFGVDTGGLKQATTDLRALVPAAEKAETAAEGAAAGLNAVEAAARGVSTTTTAATKVITAAGGVTAKTSTEYDKLARILKIVQATQASMGSGGNNDNKMYQDANAHVIAYRNSLNDANAHVVAYRQNIAKMTPELDKNAKATAGMSYQAKNLSYQLVDITQGIASGVPLFQIFAQQAGQVGQALASAAPGQNLFKEIGKSIASFITPLRLAVVGVVALVAGMAGLAISALNNAKAMDELSKSTDMSVKNLRALQQATAYKGIGADEFAQGMQSFAKQVFDAKNNAGELKGLMLANGEAAKTSADYFGKVADMVARTKSGIQQRNILEAAGLPTTQKWVDFMAQGKRGIDAVTAATVTFSESAEEKLVKKAKAFDEAWNTATTNISNKMKSLTIDAIDFFEKTKPYLDRIRDMNVKRFNPPQGSATKAAMDQAANQGSTFTDRFSGDAKNAAATNTALAAALDKRAKALAGVNDNEVKTRDQLMLANSQAQQRISLLGDLATVEQQVTAKQLELNAAGLQGVGVSSAQEKAILNNVRAQAEMNKVQQQASIGIFNLANAQKAASDTLQSWIDKGLVNKNNAQEMAVAQEVLKKNIEQTGEAAQVAASKYPQFTQAMLDAGNTSKQVDQVLTTSFNGLVSPIQDTINGVTSLKDGFKNAGQVIVKAIQEMIIKMLILKPLMSLVSGGIGGIGGFFGGLFGGKSALGNVFANDNKFAKGGAFTNSIVSKPTLFSYASGGMFGEMGEAGPEAIMPLTRGADGSLGVQMYGANRGGGTAQFNDNSQYIIGGNVTQDDIKELQKAQEEKMNKLRQQVPMIVNDTRKRGGRV